MSLSNFWKYNSRFSQKLDLNHEKFIDLSVGDTPIVEHKGVLMKLENHNPSGSHKDRSLLYQINAHLQLEGSKGFVISSSGNSGISAANILHLTDIPLHIFISEKISKEKLNRLSGILGSSISGELSEHENITIHTGKKPVSAAIKFANEQGYTNLRGSKDSYALDGFKTIAYEIAKSDPDLTDIFLPVSSATSLIGIYQGYCDEKDLDGLQHIPRFHACQTGAVNIIAREFTESRERILKSVVDSIVDKIGHRHDEAIRAITATDGTGWIPSEKEIKSAYSELLETYDDISPEAGLVYASYIEAAKVCDMEKPLILVSGRK